jgi:23S rRNA (uracil1939-C5)-methyltransferase
MTTNKLQYNDSAFTLKLDGMGQLGEAVSRIDEKKIFVFGGIPGEEVLAEIIRQRRTYIAAKTVQPVKSSPFRVETSCPYFGSCTGCQWQHIDYTHQLEIKHGIIQETMETLGDIFGGSIAPVVPAPQTFGYRNHARFTVGPGGSLGFIHRESRQFIRVESCLLMHSWINEALSQLQGQCGETTQVSIRYGVNTGSYLIQPALHRAGIALDSGQKYYEDRLNSTQFRISSPSFFQVNNTQAEQMVNILIDNLAFTGDELLADAYAGVGTFGILLAPYVRRVLAIEESASAIKDAQINSEDIPNVELLHGKTENVLGSLQSAPDILIIDPPRAGCHSDTLKTVINHPPKQVAYISCNPQSLARDLRILLNGPFSIREIIPVDLFPHTHHIECIAILHLSRSSPARRLSG